MAQAKGPGQVEVTIEYFRHVGPRYVHGGLTLSFDSLQPYSFSSEASWPNAADNYETNVRIAVEQKLVKRLGRLERTRVILKRISWDSVSSCQDGFERAARAAASAAFEL
jgi:hypothetical protein